MEVPHIMTSPNSDDQHRPDPVDWQRYENEVAEGADVVHLDAARNRRAGTDPDNPPDATPDGGADVDPDTDADEPVMVDSPAAQRRDRLNVAALRAGQRRPIIPAWLRSRAEAL